MRSGSSITACALPCNFTIFSTFGARPQSALPAPRQGDLKVSRAEQRSLLSAQTHYSPAERHTGPEGADVADVLGLADGRDVLVAAYDVDDGVGALSPGAALQ